MVDHVGAGDRPVRDEYDALVGRWRTASPATARAWSADSQRNTQVGPDPDTQPAQRAGVDALDDQLRQVGPQVAGRLLEVVVQGRGQRRGSPDASAAMISSGGPGSAGASGRSSS